MSRDLATIGDAAHLANVPARTIRRWITDGRLTTTTLRRTTYVSVSQVAATRTILRAKVSAATVERNRARARLALAPQNGPLS
jgi:predicted site-specific integrase-resolvase